MPSEAAQRALARRAATKYTPSRTDRLLDATVTTLRYFGEPFARLEAMAARPITTIQKDILDNNLDASSFAEAARGLVEEATYKGLTPLETGEGRQFGDIFRNAGADEFTSSVLGLTATFPYFGAIGRLAFGLTPKAHGVKVAERLTSRPKMMQMTQEELKRLVSGSLDVEKGNAKLAASAKIRIARAIRDRPDAFPELSALLDTNKLSQIPSRGKQAKEIVNQLAEKLEPEYLSKGLGTPEQRVDVFIDMMQAKKRGADLTTAEVHTFNAGDVADKLDGVTGIGNVNKFVIEPIRDAAVNDFRLRATLGKEMDTARKANGFSGGDLFGKKSRKLRDFIEAGDDIAMKKQIAGKDYANYERMAEFGKKKYKKLLDLQNRERIRSGQVPISERPDYVTHIYELNQLKKLGMDLVHTSADDIDRLSVKRTPTTKFAKRRTSKVAAAAMASGKDTPETLGFFEAFERYATEASKIINYTEPSLRLRMAEQAAGVADLPNAKKFFSNMRESINSRAPSTFQDLIGDSTVGRWSYILQKRFLGNVIVGNPSVFVNQILGAPGIAALTGIKNTTKAAGVALFDNIFREMGFAHVADPSLGRFAQKHSKVLQGRYAASLSSQLDPITRQGGTLLFQPPTAQKIMSAPLEWMDRLMVEVGFNAGFKIAKQAGLSVDDAVRYADRIAEMTQANYITHLKPGLVRSQAFGFFAPLQTYVLNNFNLITKHIPKLSKQSRIDAIGKMMATSMFLRFLMDETVAPQTSGPFGETLIDSIPLAGIGKFGLPGMLGFADRAIKYANGDQRIKPGRELQRLAFLTVFPHSGGALKKAYEGGWTVYQGGRVRNLQAKEDYFTMDDQWDEWARLFLFGASRTKKGSDKLKDITGRTKREAAIGRFIAKIRPRG